MSSLTGQVPVNNVVEMLRVGYIGRREKGKEREKKEESMGCFFLERREIDTGKESLHKIQSSQDL